MLTPQGFYSRPLLTIDGSTGDIIALEQYAEGADLDAMAGVEFYSGVLCRGFVNAHSHIELSYLEGSIPPGGGYAAFAARMAQQRDKWSSIKRVATIRPADLTMWREGVDAVADIINEDISLPLKQESGITYRSFAEVFGLRNSNMERCRELLSAPNVSLTPHSTYSIQDADFKAVCSAETDAPLSIHFMESEDEALLYIGKGRLHEWYKQVGFECDFLHYGSPAKRIAACVPHDRPLMLVHNCYITEQDIKTIMEGRTAPTYWVLCPRSNHYISGIEPRSVELLRRHSLRICIGTDSLASNTSLSIIEELKMFSGVPLAELLQWATTNGAEALGVENRGWVAISGVDMESMTLTPQSQAQRVL